MSSGRSQRSRFTRSDVAGSRPWTGASAPFFCFWDWSCLFGAPVDSALPDPFARMKPPPFLASFRTRWIGRCSKAETEEANRKSLTWHGQHDIRCESAPDPTIEDGRHNKALKVGDRVVVPFTISCGECFFCKRGFFSGCERSNPDSAKVSKLWGNSPAGLIGYSHLLGGYRGGQAKYLRVPFADIGPIKVPDGLSDEHALFPPKAASAISSRQSSRAGVLSIC